MVCIDIVLLVCLQNLLNSLIKPLKTHTSSLALVGYQFIKGGQNMSCGYKLHTVNTASFKLKVSRKPRFITGRSHCRLYLMTSNFSNLVAFALILEKHFELLLCLAGSVSFTLLFLSAI